MSFSISLPKPGLEAVYAHCSMSCSASAVDSHTGFKASASAPSRLRGIPDFFVGSDDLWRDAVHLVSAGRADRVIQRHRTLERFDLLCMVESRHDAHQVELDGGVGVLVNEYPGRFSVGVSVDGHR